MAGFFNFVFHCVMNAISAGCGGVYTSGDPHTSAWHGIIAFWLFLIAGFVSWKLLGARLRKYENRNWLFAILIALSTSILYFMVVYLLI